MECNCLGATIIVICLLFAQLADKQMEPKPLHSERSKEQPKIELLSNKCESLMKQLEQSQQDLFTAKENHQEEMKEMHEKIEEINSR